MKRYTNYNEENMEIEEEFLRRWKKHKNIIVGKDKDNLEWYDEVANNEVEKFFDGYKPLADLEAVGKIGPSEDIWFEGISKVLTFRFRDGVEGFKTWLRAIKAKRDRFLEKNGSQKKNDASVQTDLTAEKISQMEAQIEIILKNK